MSRCWLLNLDAEKELADPDWRRTERDRDKVVARIPTVQDLLEEGDRLVPLDEDERFEANGSQGMVWCPTSGALQRLQQVGARLPEVPTQEVLRRVNHRRFSFELGVTLPDSVWVNRIPDLQSAVARAPLQQHWLLKRGFGFSGNGNRKVRAGSSGNSVMRWAERHLETEGILVEPLVARLADFVLHGQVSREGETRLGVPCVQVCTAEGRWTQTRIAQADDISDEEAALFLKAGQQAADALHQAGYFGPFGIDGFRWRDLEQGEQFHPLVEINARYTMGWATGMAARS